MSVVVRLAERKSVEVSSSLSTSSRLRVLSRSASRLSNLKILSRAEASGVRSEWQRSARARTTCSPGSSTSTLSGEYSSSGMMRSWRYLVLSLRAPHSPMGVTPASWCQSSVSAPERRLLRWTVSSATSASLARLPRFITVTVRVRTSGGMSLFRTG